MDTTTVGVDLAKNVFVACVADCAGRIVSRHEFNRVGFLAWLGTLPAGTVIVHGSLWQCPPLGPDRAASGPGGAPDGRRVCPPLPQAPVGEERPG